MNTATYLLEHCASDQTALITEQTSHTYAELGGAVARVSAALRQRGVEPGDRVGILAGNSLYWAAAYISTLGIGAVAVPLSTSATPEEVHAMDRFVRCRAVCTDKRTHRTYARVLGDPSRLVLEDGLPTQPDPFHAVEVDPGQDAALMLTSGTTAQPRAVRITHRNIQANTDSIVEYLHLTEADRILSILPFYYCFGTSLLHTHLRAGGTLVLPRSFVYPEAALNLMEATACNGIAGVPSTYQTLLRNSSFPRRGLKCLRKIQQAGGKLPTLLIEELQAAVPDAQVFVMYGQTEATARLSYLPPEFLKTKLGSVGRGIPGVRLRVVDESGADVKPGEVGEIVAWGDNISPGYLDDPEASSRRFINGALHSGDMATVDEEGFIFIVDRKDDFIKSLGHRVSSQKIEAYVVELPDIVAAAAIGEPDVVRGEAIRVFVTLKSGSILTPEDIMAHCTRRMARHMVPRYVTILDRLPMNAHGKVVKPELRKMAAQFQAAH
jgi:long-chain acyl-CoA synthetase